MKIEIEIFEDDRGGHSVGVKIPTEADLNALTEKEKSYIIANARQIAAIEPIINWIVYFLSHGRWPPV